MLEKETRQGCLRRRTCIGMRRVAEQCRTLIENEEDTVRSVDYG